MTSSQTKHSNSIPVTRFLAILALAVALALSISGSAQAARPTYKTVCNSPVDIGETSCGTGQLESTFQCRTEGEVYICEVTYTLTVTVFGPACAEASSTWNVPVDACSVISSASNFTIAKETYHVSPAGKTVEGEGNICVRPLPIGEPDCESWEHVFFIPGDPSAPATNAAIQIADNLDDLPGVIIENIPPIIIENVPPEMRAAARATVRV